MCFGVHDGSCSSQHYGCTSHRLDGSSMVLESLRGWKASVFSWTFCSDTLLLLESSCETQKLQPAFQRVSVFHPINLCNSLFIAFPCNYSVIRLSSLQYFRVNAGFYCTLPVIGHIFSSPACVSTNKPVQGLSLKNQMRPLI